MAVVKDERNMYRIVYDGEELLSIYGIAVVDEKQWKPKPRKECIKPKDNTIETAKEMEARFTKEFQDQNKQKKKRKLRKRNRPHPDIIQEVLERDKHTCLECGSKEHLEVHHMVYRSQGGSHELNNLITLCWICHAEKHKEEPVYKLMMKRING